jgi:hypothetical protein
MLADRPLRRLSRADHVRTSFADTGGGLALPIASRRPWIAGLAIGLAFVVVTSVAWEQITYWHTPVIHTLLDRAVVVLKGLWVLALWAAAVILLVLTIALLFYRESARLADGRLIHVAHLGPLRVLMEYDLARVKNLRAVEAGKESARVLFDYGDGDHGLGNDMTTAEAEARVKMIQKAIDGLGRRPSQAGTTAPRPTPKP